MRPIGTRGTRGPSCSGPRTLNVVKAERVQRTVDTDDGPRIAIDALARLQSD
jgi:hypothetical protein